ncbi:MAG: ABC transporter ATP-binding protein [Armatimonadetes bacterium]|nr:ABC transporter ATP-binding protein [Armatimonadota bacterium]
MLVVDNLKKDYNGFQAVQGISFELEPGDVFAFIGSNGAGKTTTIRMIATLLEPSSGTASLFGVDVTKDPMAIRRMLGYMPDFFGLYDDVKVWEYLDFFATIYEVPPRERRKVIDNVLELTDLSSKRDAFVQSLSRGMQQRLCLARCLVHDPKLLLLDEPASGLDPRARSELKELILELGRMGKIVIVSSHILPELEGFCNKVGIVERGQLLSFGPTSDLTRSSGTTKHLVISTLGSPEGTLAWLTSQPNLTEARLNKDGNIECSLEGDDAAQAQLLKSLVEANLPIRTFADRRIDLEDVFFQVTTGAVN